MALARSQQDPSVIRLEKIKDTLYIITGGRGPAAQAGSVSGNTTVFITDTGVVLVDTKYPGYEAVSGLKLPDKYKDYNTTNLKADVQRLYDELKR